MNGYWEYGTRGIYATEILLWAIFLLTAVWLVAGKLGSTGAVIKNKKFKFIYAALGLFLGWALASVFWADSVSLALYVWHWFAEGAVLFLIFRVIKIDSKKVIWAFIVSALIQAGLGLWQFFSQSVFSSKWLGMAAHDPIEPGTYVVETALRRWLRAYGSLSHPNMLAGFLAAAMFLVIWLYQRTSYGLKKIFLPGIFCVLSLGLFATFSKSVIGSLTAVLFLQWVIIAARRDHRETKTDFLKFTLIFLILAAVFSTIFWEPVQTRLIGAERLEKKSTTERLNYFNESWQLIKNHPALGVGLGNYTLAAHNEINPGLAAWDYQPVHNIYLLVLAELGPIGLFCGLLLIIFLIRDLPSAFFLLPIILLTVGFFDHYFLTLYFGIIFFWLSFGLGGKISLDRPLDGA